MTVKSIITNNNFKIAVAAIIIGIITLSDADYLVTPGFDSSYRWALNYMLVFNRGALASSYSEGPLCMLKWPAPIGCSILVSSIFQILLNAWFVALFAKLYQRFHAGGSLALPLLAGSVFLMVVNIDYIFLGCVLSGTLLWKFDRQKIPLYVGALLTVLALYAKSSFFALCSSVWVMFAIFCLFEKEYKVLLSTFVAGLISYLVVGLLIFKSVAGLSLFTAKNLLQPLSYTDALSLFPVNNWAALSLTFALLLACFIIFFRQPAGYMLQLLMLCFFANWKYAIGREDFFHSLTFTYLLILVLILFVAIQKKHLSTGVLLLLLAVCSYNYSMRMLGGPNGYFWYPGFVNFNDRVLHHKEFELAAIKQSKELCRQNLLPADMRREIGNAPTDIFPWDLSIAMVNELNYVPRPLFSMPANEHGV